MLRTLHAGIERISRMAARVLGYALLATAFLVAVEVVLRKTHSFSFGGVDEISGYVLIILTAWGFSYALVTRSHIRIDVLHARLPDRLKAVLDILALVSLGVLAGLLAYYGAVVLSDSWSIGITANTPLRTPLWLPQALWVAGLVFFCLSIAVSFAYCLAALAQGRLDLVRRIAGVATARDEAEEELAGHAERTGHGRTDRDGAGPAA